METPWISCHDRAKWLKERKLFAKFKRLVESHKNAGLIAKDADKLAGEEILRVAGGDEFMPLLNAAKGRVEAAQEKPVLGEVLLDGDPDLSVIPLGQKSTVDDYDWAMQNYGNPDIKSEDQAPSKSAWSVFNMMGECTEQFRRDVLALVIKARCAEVKDGGNASDSRALERTGLPETFRERFSGLRGAVRDALSKELPTVCGCTA